MIESIQFKNFKALRDTTLPLSPCTVIVGPNASGKSTVLQALEAFRGQRTFKREEIISANLREDDKAVAEIRIRWAEPDRSVSAFVKWRHGGTDRSVDIADDGVPRDRSVFGAYMAGMRVFSLDASAIAAPVELQKHMELSPNGAGLAGVLTRLQDREPESFKSLNEELGRWLPEFDQILFDVDVNKQRVFQLRTRDGRHKIPAADVSQGTLLALTMLTLAHLPDPPSLIALEEPDRGIHPYLLRHVQDAIYRLSHPESCGEQREPVQVIATTHSPYFLDLFKDYPEEIVVANKIGADVQFQRLSEQPHLKEYLEEAHLGDIWQTGILGGVPAKP